MTSDHPCPCGSSKPYRDCCEPYLAGPAPAPTAEALMRSRYTAYHTGQAEYLIATRHPSKRQFDDRITLRQSLKTTTWLSLHILSVRQGQPQDTVSQVEFVAIYRAAAQALGQLHERSTFVQQQGRWFYLEGTMLPPHRPKRQEPCWCGSGKKFKQCHGL